MRTFLSILILAFALVFAASSHADQKKKTAIATFAGGCFWCMEPAFDDIKGVKATTSGYTGGAEKDPNYKQVSSGKTGHAEAMQVEYDPAQVTYQQLLDVYWHNVDPTVADRQFCDWGKQYRAEIFYHDAEQKRLAEASKQKVEEKFGVVTVKITAAAAFYPAEEYHQDYYSKNPDDYYSYRKGCGRDKRLQELWGESAEH